MDIEGLVALVEQLVDKGFLKDYSDIYNLKYSDLVNLERMGEKSSSNLIQAIEASKHQDLDRLICALGILNVGSHTAEVLPSALIPWINWQIQHKKNWKEFTKSACRCKKYLRVFSKQTYTRNY